MKNNQKQKQNIIIISLIFLTITISTAACAANRTRPLNTSTASKSPGSKTDIHLEAELSVPEKVTLCDPVPVTFKVTNLSDQAIYLLNWYTPLEGILGDIFRVAYEGQELPYLGPQVMRAPPLEDQYTLILAGESATAIVDLSEVYGLNKVGKFTITFQSPLISDVAKDPSEFATTIEELGPIQITSQPVEVEIVAPGKGEVDCEGNQNGQITNPDHDNKNAGSMTLTGLVKDVSLSARVIWLEEEVAGFTTIALREDCKITNPNGDPLELNQIIQGLTVEVSGQPGDHQIFLAKSMKVLPPDGKK